MAVPAKHTTVADTAMPDEDVSPKSVPLPTKPLGPAPAGVQKPKRARWTTISTLSAMTVAVFAVDFLLLGQNGEARFSLPGKEAVGQLWSFVRSSKYFGLDCCLSAVLVALIGLQLARKGHAVKGAGTRRATPHKNNKPGSQPRSHRTPPDAGGRSGGAGGAGRAAVARPAAPVNNGPASPWNQAIDLAAREGDPAKAARLLLDFERQGEGQATNRPDTVSYNLVIRAYAKKGDFRGAEEWLARMESKGLEATVCSYNTVLDACAKADNAEACEAWLGKMLSKGVEANVISYATAIYARARRGEEALAAVWLQKMLDAGVTPDSVSYNSMIHACGVSGNAVGAERWVQEMQRRGLEATVTTYTAVIDACAKCGDVARAEKWLEAMIAAEVEPNVVSFSAMIDACAKTADPIRAAHWHDRMVEFNIKPNAHSHSAVINACAKARNLSMAEEWLGRSEKAGVANDVVVYSSVIDACGKVGDAERAAAIFSRMQAHGIKPHIVAYAALARPYAYRGDWVEVERIASEMAAGGIVANEYFLYAQLLSYATARPRQAQRAEQCFREALRMGQKANDHVLGALVRAVGRERCVELMQELCNGRPLPAPRQGGGGGHDKAKPLPRRH